MHGPSSIPFGNHLVFVDESGDHSLTSIDPHHPVFVLAFVIISKADYIRQVCPELQAFKMRYWGHDEVVLHEREIRKPQDEFSFLLQRDIEKRFLADLTDIMVRLPATIVAVVIDKPAFLKRHEPESRVYDHAMQAGMNAVFQYLSVVGDADHHTPIIVESRGRREDKELELAFRRFCASDNAHGRSLPFELVMVSKLANSAGLQLSDLVARPIGLHHLRPQQPNRAYEIIETKFYRQRDGAFQGSGLIHIP